MHAVGDEELARFPGSPALLTQVAPADTQFTQCINTDAVQQIRTRQTLQPSEGGSTAVPDTT